MGPGMDCCNTFLRLVMSPLQSVVIRTKERADQLDRIGGQNFGDLQDLRTEALVGLMDALDELDPGLGLIMHMALYPGADALRTGAELGRRA